MTAKIDCYRLGADALKFLYEQLANGGPISATLKLSPGGVLWTYLPPSAVQLQDQRHLEQGGAFTSESASEILREVLVFVKAFLQEDASSILLAEDRFFGISDPPNSRDQYIFEWRGTTYHYRTHLFSAAHPQDFEEAIGSASNYPSILLLTKISSLEILPKRGQIDDALAAELAENIIHVIVGAYDEEGYLIWSNRTPSTR